MNYRASCRIGLIVAALTSFAAAHANQDELDEKCWRAHAAQRLRAPTSSDVAEVSFSNIADGYRVYSPFKVMFAVRGMGVAPAGNPRKGTGHHHILIDKKLPIDVTKGLPFDASHMHFGKGQTSAVLNLPTGKHTLRLLFADHEHKPFYVFSKEITVHVVGSRSQLRDGLLAISADRFDETCRDWYSNEMTRPEQVSAVAYFQNIRSGDSVGRNLNLRLGADRHGIGPAGMKGDGIGYFDVTVSQGSRVVQRNTLTNGETQLALALQPGSYELAVQLVDQNGRSLGERTSVKITATER